MSNLKQLSIYMKTKTVIIQNSTIPGKAHYVVSSGREAESMGLSMIDAVTPDGIDKLMGANIPIVITPKAIESMIDKELNL